MKRFVAALLSVLMMTGFVAMAEVQRLPDVENEMIGSDYWATLADQLDAVLADDETIEALNAAFLETPECMMIDLTRFFPSYDGETFKRSLLKIAMQNLSTYLDEGYYNADVLPVPFADMDAVLESIDEAETSPGQRVRYGICVTHTNVRVVPTDMIVTDSPGDNDFDVLQMSSLRVNEPVLVKAENADGSWYYCDSISCSGWVPATDVAICANRTDWKNAWQIPDDEVFVVTDGKIYLDASNVNAGASQRMLTMGTVLRRVIDEDFDATVTNRAVYHNYAVWLPVRADDGGYATTIALIPQHSGVSEGYLPLTQRNVLELAFSMLGDAYGWGGMLAVPDCSQYVRNVYKCFGMELPRNTAWQSAMPAEKYDLSEMEEDAKITLLDGLPAGAILFFKGHEMLYLGAANGKHYVVSAVSSMMAPDGESRLRVRGVVINTLEGTLRANGNTWLKDLNLALIPWLPLTEEEETAAAS